MQSNNVTNNLRCVPNSDVYTNMDFVNVHVMLNFVRYYFVYYTHAFHLLSITEIVSIRWINNRTISKTLITQMILCTPWSLQFINTTTDECYTSFYGG